MHLHSFLEPPRPRFGAPSLPWLRAGAAGAGLLPLILYLALGAALALGFHAIPGDALSRVGNAYYVLFSRDPHLGAIGFVWTPLPSLLVMPLLPLQVVFPGLVRDGYAASIVSAAAMAGAVFQMYGFISDLRVRTSTGWILTLLFALNPMIVVYGANGMSEALFVLFLTVTVRHVARWLKAPRVSSLAVAAIALALAYLTRYEAVIAAAAAASVVGGVSYLRTPGTPHERRLMATADLFILLIPIAAACVAWALASWLITGEAFPIFTSVYGNSAYVERLSTENALATGQGTPAAIRYVLGQVVGLQPLLVLLLLISAGVAAWRRDARILAVTGILGAVLAFQVFAFLSGRTYGWLRFYITAVPLATMLVALCLADDSGSRPPGSPGTGRLHGLVQRVAGSRWPRLIAGGVLAGVLAYAFWPGFIAMGDNRLGRGETAEQVNALLNRLGPEYHEQYSVEQHQGAAEIARAIDSMELPRGSVLVDSATAFPIIIQVADPRTFVITSDRDFERVLADPTAFDVQYLLVPPNFRGHDAVNRAYPNLYDEGTTFAELVRTFDAPGRIPDWRLFRVTDNT